MTSRDMKLLEVFARGLVPTLRELTARIAALGKTVEHLEQRMFDAENKNVLVYQGVWRPGRYAGGSAVTDRGSMWIALRNTTARPGGPDDAAKDWQLTVKRATL